jgi:hypothetical protein
MIERMLPAFLAAPAEGQIIGRILAGYGELEFEMGRCLGVAVHGDAEAGVRQLFSNRGEAARINTASEKMTLLYSDVGLGGLCEAILEDMDWCRELRNQYAHCSWYHTQQEGLGFVDLEKIVNVPGLLMRHRKMLDAPLLEEQETFFWYVQRCYWHLEAEYNERRGKTPNLSFPCPRHRPQPWKHL